MPSPQIPCPSCGRPMQSRSRQCGKCRVRPLEVRFWEKVERRGPNECWQWLGATSMGYGHMFIEVGKYAKAHRLAWTFERGEPIRGLVFDHLCRNPLCCNPAHLELVSHATNIRRGQSPKMLLHHAGLCANGHPRSEACLRKGTNLVAYCKACRREKRARERAGT